MFKSNFISEIKNFILYLSGPLTNSNKYIEALNYLSAHYAGELFTKEGVATFNPIQNSGMFGLTNHTWDEYMGVDKYIITKLCIGRDARSQCFLLPFWKESKGANIEKTIFDYSSEVVPRELVDVMCSYFSTRVLISGKSHSGKTTLAHHLCEEIPGCVYHIADPIKKEVHDIYERIGRKVGTKEEMRQDYIYHGQALKDIYGETYWAKKLNDETLGRMPNKYIQVVDDVRFPYEIDTLTKDKCLTVHLTTSKRERKRRGANVDNNHASETALDRYNNFDIVIENEKPEDLEIAVRLLTLSILYNIHPAVLKKQMLQLVYFAQQNQ